MGSGKQWQSWISIDDEVAAIDYLLTANVTGAVNLTAPNPVTQAEFAKTLAGILHRPSFLPVPSFGPKLLLGSELADALLFTGQKVVPEVLEKSGYSFTHPTLESALRSLLNKPS
jgi:NAD dependent epimerase/dehydratase family enzyme